MLKIECLENKINGKNVYIGYIKFSDLVKFAFLKPLTVNRITDEKRIKAMKNYIMKGESNYPPIVVAIEEGCRALYDETQNELIVEKNIKQKNSNRLVIIDGQHRYLSIKNLIEFDEDGIENQNKKQAIYILTDMSELEQRKCFMEINDNMKRVSSVSKRIFEINIPNYISLKLIKMMGIIKKINIKNDQCTTVYPYKFIQSGNKILFEDLHYKDFTEENIISKLDVYSSKANIVWEKIFNFIDNNTKLNIGFSKVVEDEKKDYKSIKTEIFIKSFFQQFKNKYTELNDIITIDDNELERITNEYIDDLTTNLNYFSYEDELNRLEKNLKEKRMQEILSGGKKNE